MSRSRKNTQYHYFRSPKNTLKEGVDPELKELGYTPKSKSSSTSLTNWDDIHFSDYSGYNNISTKHKYKRKIV